MYETPKPILHQQSLKIAQALNYAETRIDEVQNIEFCDSWKKM